MARYPIKMLKDENGTPFVPLVAPEAVKDNQGTDWQTLLNSKLEKTNIIAGDNITLSVSGNNITINSQAGGATTNVIDNLNQQTAGVGVLDAHQGYVLKGMIPGVQNNLTSTSTTDALSAYQGYLLSNRSVPGGGTTGQVLKKKSGTDNDLEWGDAASAVGDALPIGTLSPFVGLVAPKGYLICMGQLVDKAKYPELWELCGDTFGPSTTTQFYLPDLRGQVIAGYKQGDTTFGTLGALIGGKTTSYTPAGTNTGGSVGNHTLTTSEIPSHNHAMKTRYDDYNWDNGYGSVQGVKRAGAWAAILSDWSTEYGGTYDFEKNWPVTDTGGGGAHNHGFTNPTFTGTQANISTVQPTAVMNWIIKASMLAVIESNVEDSLTSTSSTDALSAKQGKVLKDLVDTNNGLAFKKSAIKTVQKRLTTDVAGNGALGMSPGNEIILSIYQLGTDANCWVTLYCYNGIYFVHTGNWDGSAFSGTATFEIVYIDRNDL